MSQSATEAAAIQQEQLARWQQALAAGDEAAAHAARDEMWEALSELFSRTAELAQAWNDFAAPTRRSAPDVGDAPRQPRVRAPPIPTVCTASSLPFPS